MSEKNFRKNVEELIDLTVETLNWVKREGINHDISVGKLTMGKLYMNTYDDHSLITGFIKRSKDHWEKIKNRDEEFLFNNSSVIFSEFEDENIEFFNKLFLMKNNKNEFIIQKETKNAFWDILEDMVKNSIKYIHEFRGMEYNEEKKKNVYKRNYFPDISIKKQVELWQITAN